MLNLAILARDPTLCSELGELALQSGVFRVSVAISPLPSVPEILRTLRTQIPEVILFELSEWETVSSLAATIKEAALRAVVVGVAHRWSRSEQLEFEAAGIHQVIQAPVTATQLETRVYDALHREKPVQHPNLLAFLPSKAVSGASTVALNTAWSLATNSNADRPPKVLLIEADSRSGAFSVLLNLRECAGLPEALRSAGEMTGLEWNRVIVPVAGIHLLAANPVRRGILPTWADYYQILQFAAGRYDYIVVDLPEVINRATSELVRAARAVFITCTPEVPSLAMASLRASELETFEIPREKVQTLVNRYERGALSMAEIDGLLGRPVFAVLPNDYREIKKAIIESRFASCSSGFGRGCAALANKISGLGHAVSTPSSLALLRRLSTITGITP